MGLQQQKDRLQVAEMDLTKLTFGVKEMNRTRNEDVKMKSTREKRMIVKVKNGVVTRLVHIKSMDVGKMTGIRCMSKNNRKKERKTMEKSGRKEFEVFIIIIRIT